MKTLRKLTLAAATTLALSASAFAASHVSMVGGAKMFADKNIIENAVNSPIHKTLVAAVKAAELVDTLQGDGPFTVFAPVDDGFAALPAGTVDTLLKPENKPMLQKVLTAHVVAGNISAADLVKKIKAGHGYTNITTVSGDTITARMDEKGVYVFDESGGVSRVIQADVKQSNGVIHAVDKVLVPK